jgi:tetratricopeptide (TPR) repeat protein
MADRLMEALDAGQSKGGDTRGMQSAGILVVRPLPPGSESTVERIVDIRVDDATNPFVELRRLLNITQGVPGKLTERSAQLAREGKFAEAIVEQKKAIDITPNNEQLHYALAQRYAQGRRLQHALGALAEAFASSSQAPSAGGRRSAVREVEGTGRVQAPRSTVTQESPRSTVSGDWRMAWTAGTSVAQTATPRRTAATVTSEIGSVARTPNSIEPIDRASSNAIAAPAMTPTTARASDWRSSMNTMPDDRAPSARRTPISFRRCATSTENTPTMPTAASATATSARPQQDRREPIRGQRRAHQARQRRHLIERQAGQERCRSRTQRRHDRLRRPAGADDEIALLAREPRGREIHRRARRRSRVHQVHVSDHPDDRGRDAAVDHDVQFAAHRILVRPQRPRHALADHGLRRAVRGVALVERGAAAAPDPQRAEVRGLREPDVHDRSLRCGHRRSPWVAHIVGRALPGDALITLADSTPGSARTRSSNALKRALACPIDSGRQEADARDDHALRGEADRRRAAIKPRA